MLTVCNYVYANYRVVSGKVLNVLHLFPHLFHIITLWYFNHLHFIDEEIEVTEILSNLPRVTQLSGGRVRI